MKNLNWLPTSTRTDLRVKNWNRMQNATVLVGVTLHFIDVRNLHVYYIKFDYMRTCDKYWYESRDVLVPNLHPP